MFCLLPQAEMDRIFRLTYKQTVTSVESRSAQRELIADRLKKLRSETGVAEVSAHARGGSSVMA